jgi:hypothetical protein
MMTKYSTLLNILDKIRSEATASYVLKYNPSDNDIEKVNQARARAFIHLYLKVSFGILEFNDREYCITDGPYDGGIDGYFINKDNKTIYFIQSKFRTSEKNFENKEIKLEEILVMDINRVLEGEVCDEQGNEYSGKIKQLKRDVTNIEDIARYKYQVIILANLDKIPQSKLRYLTGGYAVEIVNHENCYDKLVFPIISGTFFNASDVNIFIDLSNKNAGSKISYTVKTKHSECEITVLFIPTIEIAKVLHKYKNSILKYNPRSYLELEGQNVNRAIRETILNTATNEFALFNNGITMLSDETYINEKIGQKNKAQLNVKNPQIINGGQTTFTLSRIYEENINNNVQHLFQDKEVLLKIITLIDQDNDNSDIIQKLQLIDDISTATNQQTPVISADKFSNERTPIILQKILFDRYGILFERKRGEFGDGLNNNYINKNQILERNLFFRIYCASNGEINKAVEKKIFMNKALEEDILINNSKLDNFFFGLKCFKIISNSANPQKTKHKYIYGQIYAFTKKYKPNNLADFDDAIKKGITQFKKEWSLFTELKSKGNNRYLRTYIDKETRIPRQAFNASAWHKH